MLNYRLHIDISSERHKNLAVSVQLSSKFSDPIEPRRLNDRLQFGLVCINWKIEDDLSVRVPSKQSPADDRDVL